MGLKVECNLLMCYRTVFRDIDQTTCEKFNCPSNTVTCTKNSTTTENKKLIHVEIVCKDNNGKYLFF